MINLNLFSILHNFFKEFDRNYIPWGFSPIWLLFKDNSNLVSFY